MDYKLSRYACYLIIQNEDSRKRRLLVYNNLFYFDRKKKWTFTFDDIKRIDEYGNEYWLARELQVVLEYGKEENFYKVIQSAMTACKNSNYNIIECFPGVRKTSKMYNDG